MNKVLPFLLLLHHSYLPVSSGTKNNLLRPGVAYSKNYSYHFDNSVHYPAFFCKMELRFFEKNNVWLKVHAGDYDRYSKVPY